MRFADLVTAQLTAQITLGVTMHGRQLWPASTSLKLLREATRYVVTDAVMEMLDGVDVSMFDIAPPSLPTWIEYAHTNQFGTPMRTGVLMSREPGEERGLIQMFGTTVGMSEAARAGGFDPIAQADGTWTDRAITPGSHVKASLDDYRLLVRSRHEIVAIFEAIKNPRIVDRVPRVFDEALQRARAKRGKPPLLPYDEVVIHITREEVDEYEEAMRKYREGGGSKKRLHPVRPFTRVRLGKPEMVRGHWRGDHRLGVKTPKGYKVVP